MMTREDYWYFLNRNSWEGRKRQAREPVTPTPKRKFFLLWVREDFRNDWFQEGSLAFRLPLPRREVYDGKRPPHILKDPSLS